MYPSVIVLVAWCNSLPLEAQLVVLQQEQAAWSQKKEEELGALERELASMEAEHRAMQQEREGMQEEHRVREVALLARKGEMRHVIEVKEALMQA